MRNSLLLCITCFIMLNAACSRNSLELPPPQLRNVFDTTIGSGTEPRIKLRFLKTGLAGNDTTKVSLQNEGPDELAELKLLLEVTNGESGKNARILRHMVLYVDKLKAGETSPPFIVALDTALQLSNGRIIAGILSRTGTVQRFAGDYNNENNTIAFEKKGVIRSYSKVYGYILSNSTVIFRSPHLGSTAYRWNIEGALADTNFFNGTATEVLTGTSTGVFLDTLASGIRFHDNTDKKTITFRLRTADTLTTDSIDHILFTLYKN